jgi:putative transposase
MLELLVLIGRALALACRGHHELVLENVALRQQLTAMKRTMKRTHLRRRDRLFWISLTHIWRNWRTAVVLVQPATVVRWHRDGKHAVYANPRKAVPLAPLGQPVSLMIPRTACSSSPA